MSASLRALRSLQLAPLVMLVTLLAWPAAIAAAPPLPPLVDEPETRKLDWVQISSGEWIRGEFDRVHEDKLYFDSEEFDDVVIDWSDVESLLPVNAVTVRLVGRQIFTGMLVMRDREIRIESEKGLIHAKRQNVVGIIVGSGEESDYWSGKASAGLSARAGNTDQLDITLSAEIRRQTALTRFKASYTGQISTVREETTANSHRFPATFDIYLTRQFFVTTPTFEYFTDEIQNIQSRISIGASMGYEIIDNGIVAWEVGTGATFQRTQFDSVEAGAASGESDVAILVSTSIDLDLPRGLEWDNSYHLQIVATDLDKTNHHAQSVLSFDLWGPLDLDISFIFDRVENPVQRANEERPTESNDFRITMGLGVEF